MNKVILSLFAIIILYQAKSQTVYIPDTVFKAYLIADTSINTNLDSEIQETEAASFTGAIGVSDLLIFDLTGLEAFTSLSIFSCSQTPVTSIDLSNNSSIIEVHCEFGEVNSLNLSGCTSLTRIDCYCNQISTLNIDNCPSLISLDCCVNQITSIDVSNCPSFRTLFCCNNLLTSLNVKNGNNCNFDMFHVPANPYLECIEVDDPAWSEINWTDKDSTAFFSSDCSMQNENLKIAGNISVYPNPFKDYFDIVFSDEVDASKAEIHLWDLTGQEQNINVRKSESQIRVFCPYSTNGVFIVHVSDCNGLNLKYPIIKK